MDVYLLVALGSAIGGVARYSLTKLVTTRVGKNFPWGTLLVNVSGCFVIGLFGTAALSPDDTALRHLFTFGLLGGYTTFSSFSLETFYLARREDWLPSVAYVAASFAACILAAFCGMIASTAFIA